MSRVFFSIIIPVLNEIGQIQRCVESIQKNIDFADTEIIIADNGSTDGTVELLKRLPIKLIENLSGKRHTIAQLRNLAAQQAQGDVLAFLDADMMVPLDWLHSARQYFQNGFNGALGFVEKPDASAGWVGKVWGERLWLTRDQTQDVDFLPGRNIMINRQLFEKINGFDENLRTAEDKDLTFRIVENGGRVISVPDVHLIHLGYEKTLGEFIRKEFWRQGSTVDFIKRHNLSWRTLRHPLLSIFHIFMMAFVLLLMLFQSRWTWIGSLIWLLPSSVIVWTKIRQEVSLLFILQFYFLTFLRWHVAGAAFIYQISQFRFK